MSKYGDSLLALWDNVSRGTKDMIRRMNNKDKDVFVVDILN